MEIREIPIRARKKPLVLITLEDEDHYADDRAGNDPCADLYEDRGHTTLVDVHAKAEEECGGQHEDRDHEMLRDRVRMEVPSFDPEHPVEENYSDHDHSNEYSESLAHAAEHT